MQTGPALAAPAFRRIDLADREPVLEQTRIAAQVLLEPHEVAAMKRHHRRVGQSVAALRKDLENRVLFLGMPAIRLEHHRKRSEAIAVLVRERRVRFRGEADAVGIERLARAHHYARLHARAVGEEPARALDLPLKHRAIDRVLKVARAKRRHRLDDLEPANVRRMAHRRAPVAAPQRDMQYFRMRLDEPNGGSAIVGANRGHQLLGDAVRGDALLQLGPMREAVLASDDVLRVAQATRARGNARVIRIGEFGMAAADTVERVAIAVAPEIEELAGLALRDIEMGPIG